MTISFDFSGKKVLVTGASSGIGLGVARAFATSGADVYILAESSDIHSVAETLPGKVTPLQCDISDRDAVTRVLSALPQLDVLVNNAGMERPTPLNGPAPQTDDTFEKILAVNIAGTSHVTRALVNQIKDGGKIILTSSIWGKTSVPEFSAYAASKHAMIGLTRTWAQELGPRNICVNAVCPGWIKTESALASLKSMAQTTGRSEAGIEAEISATQALPGLMVADDIAGLYLFLASPAANNITGQAINIDRGEVMV
ncbi:MAG: 3-beta hydroxysteroid dehydrogenase [Oceanospirillaceae bacterium]|nr:3-beta hydroxysteroid dehydrogenase [Oceanospirillaceae bacterium]MBT12848.1 3-beta hydroxysteroid dehydrogenase [Oceanospirillaceae bacterium]|tara:strand:+ start:74030 stop:74797 length:768 start_codon:yes stop_codon:yes gene_type:complete